MLRPLVVGLGSPHGDDQAGWLVVTWLREHGWANTEARVAYHPADLLDWLPHDGPLDRPLVICDAASGTGVPGARLRWTWPGPRWPPVSPHTSHVIPLVDVLQYARNCGQLPRDVCLWTIEGADWSPMEAPSAVVATSASTLAELLHLQLDSRTS